MFNLPTINMVKTGQNIIRLRKAQGLSVKDLQDVFGFTTPQAIYKWQQGTALPTIDNLVVLADALQVTVNDIPQTDLLFEHLMGTAVTPRKKFIQQYSKEATYQI